MPELRGECVVSRRWRLNALVTGITLVSGVTAASSTIDGRPVLRRRQILAALTRSAVPTLWPVDGAITSPFGWRRSPYGGAREWHPGIDIAAPYGTPVRATAGGEVVFAGRAGGYGALVVLDHGGISTRYAHLAVAWVRAGEVVVRGEPVGALGGTGRATAPHLHYEVRIASEAFDPQCLLPGVQWTAVVDVGRGVACDRVHDGAPEAPHRGAGIAG
jgi:murein DD-endopeptidase MepM/ murein hydrolase activator NlpD